MDKISIQAQERTELGKQVAKLRQAGKVPGVIYGHDVQSQPVALDSRELEKAYRQAGSNKLVELEVGSSKYNVLVHDVQLDWRSGAIKHVDLYKVRMDEMIKTEIPLRFVGESTAVYQLEGTLLKSLEEIEVEALPGDLPEAIEVDISVLDDFEKSIHVSDLKVPKGVEILVDAEELVVKVDPPRSDAEMEELESEITQELPEGAVEEQIAVKEENSGGKDRESKGR